MEEIRRGVGECLTVLSGLQAELLKEVRVVMVVESRESNPAKRNELIKNLCELVSLHFGVSCQIDLVPPKTLPRTSSGKLSRSKAKQDFLARTQGQKVASAASE